MEPRRLARPGWSVSCGAVASFVLGASTIAGCTVDHAAFPSTASAVTVVAIPTPGSATSSPETALSFRSEEPIPDAELDADIVVAGSESGPVAGTLEHHADGRGMTFTPASPFAPGETVAVDVPFAVVDADGGYTFVLSTPAADRGAAEGTEPPSDPDAPPPMPASSRSRPDLRPPTVVVNGSTAGEADDGLLFATPQASRLTDAGVLIYDDSGEIVYFRPTADAHVTVGDAAVTELEGEPVLRWFEGIAPFGPGNYRGEYVFVDTAYREVARLDLENGYRADIHDVVITPDGTAIMMGYYELVCDDTVLTGCTPDGTVLDGVVQEVDIATDTVLFEWHGLDHLSMADSYEDPEAEVFDYLHLNSIDLDEDGNILLSARHTSALYKVDRTTGDLIFTFGGRNNEFTYVDEGSEAAPGPDYPHDFRARGDGVYGYFDNGVRRRRNAESRAAIVELDTTTMTATYLESITHDPPLLGPTQGRLQQLPNGNELVAWGGLGVVTEYTPDGSIAFESSLGVSTYRQVRHEWVGAPPVPPAVVVTGDGDEAVTVAVSWNGDTRTESWQLLAGEQADALEPVGTVARTGFETEIPTSATAEYVAVQALDADGEPIAGGRTETLSVRGA
jgi:hypothetical protein